MAASFSASASHFVELIHKDGGSSSYNKWANNYEEDVNSMNYSGYKSVGSKWLSCHMKLATDSTGTKHKVFDAGCGTGLVGERLVTLIPRDLIEISGGDVSSNMLDVARSKNIYSDLQIINLKEKLPFEANSFDSVVCAGVFGIAHCGPECVPNLIRVLKGGCYLIATVNQELYCKTKEEWDKQIKECNCELIENSEMPYRDAAVAIVLVIRKPL